MSINYKKIKGESVMNFLNVKEYGVKKTWDNQWETFAHTPDGKYLMPITWAREVYKTKKEAKRQIEKLAKKWNWKQKENQ
jgi:hypothetical protein